jgi:NAD(P)-dependent dehydrogenase (short-subunit alcohol dehydrogenase family)
MFQGTALVTGAGDGIGEMLARGFAGLDLRVCVQDIRGDAAERVAEEIGGDSFPLVFDVSDRDACLAAAEDLQTKGLELNLLWINAGVGVGAPVVNGRQNTVEWAFGVNVLGAIWTAQAFRPLMDDAEGLRHVGITASSAALRKPTGDFPLYATTKHATFAVAETMRDELARDDIGTTILCPGLVATDIWDAARARPEKFGGPRRQDRAIAGRWKEARSPDLMWPHIVRTIEAGGGYLVCATDGGDTEAAFRARTEEIAASIVEI